MITLERLCRGGPPCQGQIVLIFGLGLIGRSIVHGLHRRSDYSTTELPYSWSGGSAQAMDGQRIVEFVSSRRSLPRGTRPSRESPRVDLVWSAGRGGFGSTEEQLGPELRSFESVLMLASRIRSLHPECGHAFHMISSAGGLFEGQRNVGPESRPEPKGPYAALKLKQEELLGGLDPAVDKFVYRPSSVYGFVAGGMREGLLTTLISNGIRRQVSRVFGEPGTLRDYVLASDVGQFVADRLVGAIREHGIFTLASGKPSTISEILRMTEALIDRSLYVVFQQSAVNAEHNTFRPDALPVDWSPTALYTGMQQTKLRLLEFFAQKRSWSTA